MNWPGIFEDANLYFGIPLAVAGFGATYYQALRARGASEAARDAAQSAEQTISRNHLLVLLPQLQRVENDLDFAVEQGDRKLASFLMSNWRWQAGQLRGFLKDDPQNRKTLKAIQTSITLAASAKIDVLDTANPVAKTARPVQDAIAAVTGDLGHLTVKNAKQGGA